jgi:hypothetical protein
MPTKFENMIMDQYVQTAYGPADDFTQMATEMAGGTEPPGATPMTLKEFATSAADVPAGLLKGAIQGSIGLPGDLISLVRGVYDFGRSGGDVDAFLAGIEKATGLPTTEDMKKFFDETLGIPLVPAGASERRREAAKIPEFVGELGGAGQTVIEGSRAAARGARQIGREIATEPPTGAVQMAPTPVQAPKSEIGFYSAVEETVANLPQAKGTGQQYLAQISKTAGVKPEELQWTGLDEFLKGKKSVTKAEVQDYLAANRVDVQEVRLGGQANEQSLARVNQANELLNQLGDEFNAAFGGGRLSQLDYYNLRDFWSSGAIKNNANDLAKIRNLNLTPEERNLVQRYGAAKQEYGNARLARESASKPQFSRYTLPGGENYREILLTLPAKDVVSRAASKTPSGWGSTEGGTEGFVELGNTRADFKSGHFDQPNVLAHMRVNDRVVDGKKTLFIEEIQSDWHQLGRKKGYADAGKPYEVFDPKDGNVIATFKTEQEAKAYADELGPNVDYAKSEGVPDAPFKTSWHELSLKRAIQEASEKGYDQIAFTTGKTQAERYDLSKQINSIALPMVNPDGTRSVRINAPSESFKMMVDKDGVVTGYYSATQFTGKPLDEVVGKEMAAKIMDATEPKEFSGLDLQVGGEGMKGFYDNILPKSLEKLGKKFDAKVGKTEMDGVEVWQMGITPKMRESAISKGQPLFVAPVVAPGMMQDEESK